MRLPAGHHLNPSAPHRYVLTVEDGAQHLLPGDTNAAAPAAPKLAASSKDLRLPLRLPLRALAPGASALRLRLTLYYCREDNTGVCRIKTLSWLAPVEVTGDPAAPREIKVEGEIKE